MIQIIWLYALYALGGFLLGFIFSMLWEWLYFRQKRLRIENSRITELEETVRSLTRTTAPDAMPPVDAWPPPEYESPGVFLESEESTMRTRATPPQVLHVEPPAPMRMTVTPTAGSSSAGSSSDGSSSAGANGFEYETQRSRRRVSPIAAAAVATTAGIVAASQPEPASAATQTAPPSPTPSPLTVAAVDDTPLTAANHPESALAPAQRVTAPSMPPAAGVGVTDAPPVAASQVEIAPASTPATASSPARAAALAATGATLIAASQPEPAPTPAPAAPPVSPLTAAPVADTTFDAASQPEPEPTSVPALASVPAATLPTTTAPPLTRATTTDADLVGAGQTEPTPVTAQASSTPPLTAAAVATLAAVAGAIGAATSQPGTAIEPASSPDGVAVVEERLDTAEGIIGDTAVVVLAGQPDVADLTDAAPQRVVADESTILPAKIDTLVAKIEHLIDTIGTPQPAEGVSPVTTTDHTMALWGAAIVLPLAESRTGDGNSEMSSELDGAYSAKNLSRGEYAVVQVLQGARKIWRNVRSLYGNRYYGR